MACFVRRVERRQTAPSRRADRKRCVLPNTWNLCTSRTHRAAYTFSELSAADEAVLWGCVAVAARMYGVQVAYIFVAANHVHILCKAAIPEAVSRFHAHFKAQFARYIQRTHGRSGAVWGGRFHNLNLVDDEAQVVALRYCMDHGMRDLLVAHPDAWPLPHTLAEAVGDGVLRGVAWRRAVGQRKGEWRTVTLKLTPLDRWAGDRAGFSRFVQALLDDRVAHFAELRAAQAEAYDEAVAEAVAAGGDPAAVDLPTGRLRSIIRQRDYIPTWPKQSLARRFAAAGPGWRARLEAAEAGHRAACEAYEDTVYDVARGHLTGEVALPVGYQWPTALAAAFEVAVIATPWAEIFAASTPVDHSSAWAQAG